MTGSNNLSDKEIRDLLRRRLLEQGGEDDLLTQKLIDMEAKLAFSDEALEVPSLQKENELFERLRRRKSPLLKWLLPAAALLILMLIILYKTVLKKAPLPDTSPNKEQVMTAPEYNLPALKTDVVVLTDSAFSESRIANTMEEEKDSVLTDTLQKEKPDKFLMGGDAGIKPDYKPKKHNPKFVDAYDNIPELSDKEREVTKKFKDRMVKQILKKDKSAWSLVPMSTENIKGETVSLNAFYIATAEVTNNQYRTFLNDLIVQGKIDAFIKAVPDTSKWISDGRALYYKLQPDSTKWPGPVANHFEPMRKNYYWHPAYDSYPVVNVSREGAKLYCDWLTEAVNEKIKKDNPESKWNSLFINDIRIPQDIEWITAARGNKGSIDYPWSYRTKTKGPQNSVGCYLANFCIRNYKEEVACPNKKIPNAFTSAGTVSNDYAFVAPVMSYNYNDYGLFCTSGNVAEMVWVNKTGKPGTKGGSWGSDAEHIKIEAEDEYEGITDGSIYIGFRPVFTAPVKK